MKKIDKIRSPLRNRISTPQAIAGALRTAIIEGALLGGESLRQEELAHLFEVSRIPVREALRQLETEGWVVFLCNKGASVAPLSIDEVREIYEILAALECTALRLAIPHHTEATLSKAEEALYAPLTTEAEDVNRNSDFHLLLYAPAQRPRLLNLITAQRQRLMRYLRLYFALEELKYQAEREHAEILEACRQRDIPQATILLERHLLQTGAFLAQYLEEQTRKRSTFSVDKALMALQREAVLNEPKPLETSNK